MGASWNKNKQRNDGLAGGAAALIVLVAIVLIVYYCTLPVSILYGCLTKTKNNDTSEECVILTADEGGKWKTKDECDKNCNLKWGCTS